MSTNSITPELNSALNEVKALIRKKVNAGIIVKGEFVANTNQSKHYLAFINLYNIPGLIRRNAVTHYKGLELSALNNPEACAELIINEIKTQGLINSLIFND
jgi:desulfoferrodoxin (superoxide reductase-like protein)